MSQLKLGLMYGYWGAQPPEDIIGLAQEVERLGFDSVWTAEAWGSDAFTPLAWIGAHTSKIKLGTSVVQLSARTPTATAMAALTLDHLSGGRMILGLGVSGVRRIWRDYATTIADIVCGKHGGRHCWGYQVTMAPTKCRLYLPAQ